MNGADRKAFKSELRAALRRRALGIPQPTQAEVLLLWMDWLHRHDRDGARRLMAWATGVRLTVLAFHEQFCPDQRSYNALQSRGVNSHLCGLMTKTPARSQPSRTWTTHRRLHPA